MTVGAGSLIVLVVGVVAAVMTVAGIRVEPE